MIKNFEGNLKISFIYLVEYVSKGFLVAQLVKNLPTMQETSCSVGDLGSIPGLGRSPEEGNGYPLWYSCLENSMDRGVWLATVLEVPKFGHD